MSEPTRYHALLKVCDLAVAQAAATHTDDRPELWATLSVALHDDCPEQSAAAARVAAGLRIVEADRQQFLSLVQKP